MNKRTFRGTYVSGTIYKGSSGRWVTDVSYVGLKSFETKQEAMNHLERYGVFQ